MFIQNYNHATGQCEIYCTECERFINEVCVNYCPAYNDMKDDMITQIKKIIDQEVSDDQ